MDEIEIAKIFLGVLVEEIYRLFLHYFVIIFIAFLTYFGYFKKHKLTFIWNFKRRIESNKIAKELDKTIETEKGSKANKIIIKNALDNAKSLDRDTKILALQELAEFDTDDALNGLYELLITESDITNRKLIIKTLFMIITNSERKTP